MVYSERKQRLGKQTFITRTERRRYHSVIRRQELRRAEDGGNAADHNLTDCAKLLRFSFITYGDNA
jgi:hypothetical protein